MQKDSYHIIIFLFVASILILIMVIFIITVFYLYRNRQLTFKNNIEAIKSKFDRELLTTKLEIQEETFEHISREIHDNISLSLTLAKLHLNTLDLENMEKSLEKINTSISLLGKSIYDLSDISKSLNADIIIQNGLLKALQDETEKINGIGMFRISMNITGEPIYMDFHRELVIFRVIQEAFNNIIKHSQATFVDLTLHFDMQLLYISIVDNGIGFVSSTEKTKKQAGIKNMEARVKTLEGRIVISSLPKIGTTISFTIPCNADEKYRKQPG